MLLLLLPLLLNPLGLLVQWFPLLYLSSWPFIMENLGRDTLNLHALLLILFIMTCDLARQFMLNLIGFDLMSLPAGIGVLLLASTTDKGSFILGLLQPVFSGLMSLSEPAFLMIEVYLLIDLVKSFNKWLGDLANERDSESRSIGQWEEPLSRKAIVARIAVIFLTLACYLGTYLIVRESRMLIEGTDGSLPINFTHAIAALTSLQLIALSVTIYRDDGVISETAMISLLASLPILLAAWSYSNLKSHHTTLKTGPSGVFFGDKDDYSSSRSHESSSWAAYFPFSILAGPTSSSGQFNSQQPDNSDKLSPFSILWAAFQQGTGHWTRDAGQSALFGDIRRNPTLDTDLFGLLLRKLTRYYSGPDCWTVLLCRLLCVGWWCSRYVANATGNGHEVEATTTATYMARTRSIWRRWPLSRAASIKILLVLTYAQMLTQQMDNRHQLELWWSEPPPEDANLFYTKPEVGESWLSCMWSSARACVAQATGSSASNKPAGSSATQPMLRALRDLFSEASQQLLHLAHLLLAGLQQLPALVASLGPVWLARWRSLIIQRLIQSSLVQLGYISCSLLSTSD